EKRMDRSRSATMRCTWPICSCGGAVWDMSGSCVARGAPDPARARGDTGALDPSVHLPHGDRCSVAGGDGGDAGERLEEPLAVVVERAVGLLGGLPEDDHQGVAGLAVDEVECAGEAGLVVERRDELLVDDPVHLAALVGRGAALDELCVHAETLLSCLLGRCVGTIAGAPWRRLRGHPPGNPLSSCGRRLRRSRTRALLATRVRAASAIRWRACGRRCAGGSRSSS